MVSSLQRDFPQACKMIFLPIHNIYEYFDHYDVHMHGTDMVYRVLYQIAFINQVRVVRTQNFAAEWLYLHCQQEVDVALDSLEVFTSEEKDEHSEEFLEGALGYINYLRSTEHPIVAEEFPRKNQRSPLKPS
ncbi:MAG: hypothetical protein H7X86_10440 [Gorillibacterium sp.]|nr:hypothetical protein [Gorillibacterium sp.]